MIKVEAAFLQEAVDRLVALLPGEAEVSLINEQAVEVKYSSAGVEYGLSLVYESQVWCDDEAPVEMIHAELSSSSGLLWFDEFYSVNGFIKFFSENEVA